MERLTKRKGRFTYHSKYGCELCAYDSQKKSTFCENIDCGACKDRSCPYLRVIDRLADYEDTGLTPGLIAALLADLKKADTDCSFCAHNAVPAPCEGTDNMCDQCTEDCICKTCRDNSNWVWCSPDKRVKHGRRA